MANAQLRTQLAVRMAYEEMFLGGRSMAVQLIENELKTTDNELHPKFTMVTFLLKAVNLHCESNKNYLLAGAHFLLHSMKYDSFPLEAGNAQDQAMETTMRLTLRLANHASVSSVSEDMLLVTMAMSDVMGNVFGAATWTEGFTKREPTGVETKRESMAFPHAASATRH